MAANVPAPTNLPTFLGHDNSHLGVMMDHYSFDSEDDLGFRRDAALGQAIDEEQSFSDSGAGARVLRNGKVRRKLRWKPAAFRRKHKNRSSNASVVSALTAKSSATMRSTSTSKSFLSHFSRKSQNSFHTFHSTETPVVKNSNNTPHTFQRPHYPDTFDEAPKHATIDSEGQRLRKATKPANPLTVGTIDLERSSTLPSRLDSMLHSPMSDLDSPVFSEAGSSSSVSSDTKVRPEQAARPSKRPPLFNRLSKRGRPPPSPSQKVAPTTPKTPQSPPELENQTAPTITSSGSPLSATASLEQVESILPTLETEDYEDDRRVALNIRQGNESQIQTPDRKVSASLDHRGLPRPEHGPATPSSGGPIANSLNTTPDRGTNRSMDGTPNSRDESPLRRAPKRTTVPVDVDDGAFLEAERNLRAIHDMAAEHLAHGEYEEAIDVFEEILRGQQARYGSKHFRVGTALHNLGLVHRKRGDRHKAIQVCRLAVKVRKEALAPNHPDVAVSLAQLGVAHLESEDYEESLVSFREALHIRRNALGPRHPKCAKILNNIGCAHYSMADYEDSMVAFSEALDIQRETLRVIVDDAPDQNVTVSNGTLLSIASTLCNIGSIKLKLDQFEEAGLVLEEALLLQQSVLPDDHPTVKATIDSIEFTEQAEKESIPSASTLLSRWSRGGQRADRDDGILCTVQPDLEDVLNVETLNALSPETWFEQVGDAIAERTGCVSMVHGEYAPGDLSLDRTKTTEQDQHLGIRT